MDHRGNADLDLGHAEMGIMRRNPQIAGGGDFEAAAEAPAWHSRDYGRRELAHGLTEVAQPRDEGLRGFLVEFCHLLDVGAADHALFALAGQDQRADGAISGELLKALADAVDDGGTEDIERAGVADRQAHHASGIAVDAAMGIEHFHVTVSGLVQPVGATSGALRLLVKGRGEPWLRRNTRVEGAKYEIDAAFFVHNCYYMTVNI